MGALLKVSIITEHGVGFSNTLKVILENDVPRNMTKALDWLTEHRPDVQYNAAAGTWFMPNDFPVFYSIETHKVSV